MRVFLVAGEASGDQLGAALMAGLSELAPGVEFLGVGGARMAEAGLASLFPMEELSVMGLAEVLPRYPALRRRMIETSDAVIAARPDVLVTIDSPDFCLRVARRVKRRSTVRIVHYVAPSVWAWRAGRAARMAQHVDQVLALLPFEPLYMEAAGMRCDFVGHPVVSVPVAGASQVATFRETHGLGEWVLALPGSRGAEVARLAPVFGAALSELRARRPDLGIVVPVAPGREAAVAEAVRDWPPVTLVPPEDKAGRAAAFAGATAALAASGTVSLELAAADTPMVVAWDTSWASWQILRRMVRTDTVTLVNLVAGENVVPEFLGPACRPGPIAAAMERLLDAPEGQRAALERAMTALGRDGEAPGLRAARAVLAGLGRQPA